MLAGALAAALALGGCSKTGDNGDSKAPPKAEAPIAIEPAAPEPAEKPSEKPAEAAAAAAIDGEPAERAETAEYVVEVVKPAQVSSGAATAVGVVVRPKGHWKFNLDYPTSVTIEPPQGASVANPKQSLAEAVASSEEEGATWRIEITPAEAGEQGFTADIKFAVCTETTCDPKNEKLAFVMDVK